MISLNQIDSLLFWGIVQFLCNSSERESKPEIGICIILPIWLCYTIYNKSEASLLVYQIINSSSISHYY